MHLLNSLYASIFYIRVVNGQNSCSADCTYPFSFTTDYTNRIYFFYTPVCHRCVLGVRFWQEWQQKLQHIKHLAFSGLNFHPFLQNFGRGTQLMPRTAMFIYHIPKQKCGSKLRIRIYFTANRKHSSKYIFSLREFMWCSAGTHFFFFLLIKEFNWKI